jgi:hypothetical protein
MKHAAPSDGGPERGRGSGSEPPAEVPAGVLRSATGRVNGHPVALGIGDEGASYDDPSSWDLTSRFGPCHRQGRCFVYMVEGYAKNWGKDGAMQTDERVIARPAAPPRLEARQATPVRQEPRPEVTVEHLLARLIVVAVGFGIALTGFMVMLSIFLVFIGFPLFFVGLAVMEVGLKGWQ